MKTIVIDPGHGGEDSGAVGPSGLMEKGVVLSVGKMLAERLRGTLRVLFTRERDEYISLSDRAAFANSAGADLFLSIHCNAAGGVGYECFTSPGDTGADPFATSLFQAFKAQFPNRVARHDLSDGDPDKEARFTVLTKTIMPAALFELEFIDTYPGENFLRQGDNQQLMAEALAEGILSHLGLSQPAPPITIPPAPPEVDWTLLEAHLTSASLSIEHAKGLIPRD